METIFNQEIRRSLYYDADVEIKKILKLSTDHEIKVGEVIDILKFLEMKRANDLFVANGEILDEQLGGFGILFQYLNDKFDELIEVIKDKK